MSKTARRRLAAGIALVILAGAATAAILVHAHDLDVKRHERAAAARLLGYREQVAEEARNRRATEPRLARVIASDARKLARAGVLEGPILGATCTPMRTQGEVARPSITSYNCIAIRRRRGRTIEGARFFATIDARTGSYTFGGD